MLVKHCHLLYWTINEDREVYEKHNLPISRVLDGFSVLIDTTVISTASDGLMFLPTTSTELQAELRIIG